MHSEQIPSRVAGAVEAEVDGERVLLSPKTFAYFGLTGSGAAVWDAIDGTRTITELVALLATQFDADPTVIEAETIEFVDALATAGLVTIAP